MSKTNTSKSSASAESKKASSAKAATGKTAAPAKEEAKAAAANAAKTASVAAKTAAEAKIAVRETAVKSVTVAEDREAARNAEATKIPGTAKTNTELDLKLKHESVAQFAYFIWEKEGYQHGRDKEHWLQAEEHLKNLASSRN